MDTSPLKPAGIAAIVGLLVLGTIHWSFGRLRIERDGSPPPSRSVALPSTAIVAPTAREGDSGARTRAGWKEYHNQKFHYGIAYPEVAKLNTSDPANVQIEFLESSSGATFDLVFHIKVNPNPSKLDLKTFAFQGRDEDSVRAVEETTVSGNKALRMKVSDLDSDVISIFIAHDGQIYELSYADPQTVAALAPEKQKSFSTFMKEIASEFRFLGEPVRTKN